MNETVIHIAGLKKTFGHRTVLEHIDLCVPRGAVVGPRRHQRLGKSTSLKCLLGLLRTSAGAARLFGEDSWSLGAAAKARLGYVPQDVRLYPWMTAPQVIAYTAAFYPRWDHALTSDLVRRWRVPTDQPDRALLRRLASCRSCGADSAAARSSPRAARSGRTCGISSIPWRGASSSNRCSM